MITGLFVRHFCCRFWRTTTFLQFVPPSLCATAVTRRADLDSFNNLVEAVNAYIHLILSLSNT